MPQAPMPIERLKAQWAELRTLPYAQAVRLYMRLTGATLSDAEERVAFMQGKVTGDVVDEPA